MKNKFLLFALLLSLAATVVSCASQKYGCPTAANQNTRFNK